MSRFDDSCDYEQGFQNQADLWHANARRALAGKRGKKALAELRDALLALPEKRLINGALCTVNPAERRPLGFPGEFNRMIETEGEGVCAIGAFLWHKQVKAGVDPQEAFASLPTLSAEDDGPWATADAGAAAGLTYTLAWELAYRNDELLDGMDPEDRYTKFMEWLDQQLAT